MTIHAQIKPISCAQRAEECLARRYVTCVYIHQTFAGELSTRTSSRLFMFQRPYTTHVYIYQQDSLKSVWIFLFVLSNTIFILLYSLGTM
jgi:hypothetical protein